MDIQSIVNEFIENIKNNKIDLYNEAGIQYELAIFLRSRLKNYKIQLERNISYFGLNKNKFEKKEIDVIIFSVDKKEKLAIEIKFPSNGQYPEQIFSFCKDIKFLEQLKDCGFENNLFLVFTNQRNFWSNKGKEGTIYYKFRNKKVLDGIITKPTGSKDEVIELVGKYNIEWKNIDDNVKFFIVRI